MLCLDTRMRMKFFSDHGHEIVKFVPTPLRWHPYQFLCYLNYVSLRATFYHKAYNINSKLIQTLKKK